MIAKHQIASPIEEPQFLEREQMTLQDNNFKRHQKSLHGTVSLVTGASRGIGASIAIRLAAAGSDVALNYRSKGPRAEEVAEQIRASGQSTLVVQGDLTNTSDIRRMIASIAQEFSRLDVLILNASGGLEKDKEADYAMRLNLNAQLDLVHAALPQMPSGSRIVFVTSHLAHFSDERPVMGEYEPVALSKRAGELALRNMIPALTAKGISVIIVSGDLIEGTITPKLLERRNPGLISARRSQVGPLPDIEEFASAIVDAASNRALETGSTIYVGSTA